MMQLGKDLSAFSPAMKAPQTPFRRFLSDYCESKLAVGAFIAFIGILLTAVFAPVISIQDPYDLKTLSILDNNLAPGRESLSGMTFWLGSDGRGRDMLSAIFYGLRTSLAVGALSGLVAAAIGTCIGVTAGYLGGRIDAFIMRLVDLQLGFPSILVALILLVALGQGIGTIIVALIAVQWAYYTRTARASALVESRREYVAAARCFALGHFRIVFRHILPNCLPPLIVVGTVQIAHAIALEATLSFLGLGIPPTEPSLGLLIASGFEFMLSGHYWISIFPGIALVIIVMSINLVGDQLRDVLNPLLQK